MDIEAAIRRMRELSKEIDGLEVYSASDVGRSAQLAEEMAQVWDGIDQWMSKGGWCPESWAQWSRAQ